MMKNTIDACVEFDFKGRHHELCVSLDLDQAMAAAGTLPSMYPLIARQNHIDTYSYEYEMMQAEDIQIRNASGMVQDFVCEGRLDVAGFESHWRELKVLTVLGEIVKHSMNVDDLDQQPALKSALLAAYQLGEAAGQRG